MNALNEAESLNVLLQQIKQNPWFGRFAEALGFFNQSADSLAYWQWPYMPVQVFKDVDGFRCTDHAHFDCFYASSGTSAINKRAKHYVRDEKLYQKYSLDAFHGLYPFEEYAVIAFLPAYTDNPHSSLLRMVDFIIEADSSGLSHSLDVINPQISAKFLEELELKNKKVLLFGAAFGLVEWAQKGAPKLPKGSIIMETGGMKTHRREMTRSEIKSALSDGFGVAESAIHSEFGMCELLSQAYEQGDGWYQCPPWMHVFARPENDPFAKPIFDQEGQLYVIDLVNKHSCSFLQLQDRGTVRADGRFQVLGRLKSTDLRGCNFLMEQEV